MFFSEYFKIDSEIIKAYGAIDISLVCDLPLFMDPMLIFNSERVEYQQLHNEIIRYFHFLSNKAKNGLSKNGIKAWFSFNEIPNNWMGYSLIGNKGRALGENYSNFLYENISFALTTNNISKGQHIEKAMLLYEGSGKDKISDLTVNLIKKYLLEYTEKFALEYVNPSLCKKIPVDKAYFNYDTESFVSKEYTLPFIYNGRMKSEYVLLTPFDILREDEPAINRKDFFSSHERIRSAIDNDVLRAFVNNYIYEAVRQYEESQKRNKKSPLEKSIAKIEKNAFKEIVKEYPELYDYYIKLRETDTDEIKAQCSVELNEQLNKLLLNSKKLISIVELQGYSAAEKMSAREEAQKRLKFFKHIIEDCDGYKNLYTNGKQIAKENDLQRLFKFVWYGTSYKLDCETNNGRGQADFIVSKGQYNQNIIEFKLASNSSLAHIFTQIKIYEAANCADGSLMAIFCFSENEHNNAKQVIINEGYKEQIDKAIFLIDCRNDNKLSASIA